MNSKFLYAATVVVSLVSTLAMADAAVSREQVGAELRQAVADGTLQRTDYDADRRDNAAVSTASREQIAAELARAQTARKALPGPFADSRYNALGAQAFQTSTLARAKVRDEVRQAAADGTLQRTDHDDAALAARRADAHVAATRFAQRFKARLAADHV